MASAPNSKVSYHARSISLPSAPHTITEQFDEQLNRLRSSQEPSTSSSPSLTHRLAELVDLYCCADELLQLPSTRQSLSEIQSMLDGSVILLDICSTSRDVLLQSKERLQDIQSVLRRRSSSEMDITKEVVEYLNTRKTAKNAIKSCSKSIHLSEINANEGSLQGVEAITMDIFKSLLSYIGGAKLQSRKSSWSLVGKLVNQAGDNKKALAFTSEFDAVDASLSSLICHKKKSGISLLRVENLMSQIVNLDSRIQELDEVLECLFRRLVKSRSTLLNIVSN